MPSHKEETHLERINDPQLLQSYLEQYHLQEHFTGDLAQMGMLLRYAPNEKIAQIGVRCEYFYILVKGECMQSSKYFLQKLSTSVKKQSSPRRILVLF